LRLEEDDTELTLGWSLGILVVNGGLWKSKFGLLWLVVCGDCVIIVMRELKND